MQIHMMSRCQSQSKEADGQATQEMFSSDRFKRLREIVKYYASTYLRTETIGYLEVAEYMYNQGIPLNRMAAFAQRMRSVSEGVYSVTNSIAV